MKPWTNYHCHTSVDPSCLPELTPAYYAGALGDKMRCAVITDDGIMQYFHNVGTWAAKVVRDLNNRDIFSGIETDVMRDGRERLRS